MLVGIQDVVWIDGNYGILESNEVFVTIADFHRKREFSIKEHVEWSSHFKCWIKWQVAGSNPTENCDQFISLVIILMFK